MSKTLDLDHSAKFSFYNKTKACRVAPKVFFIIIFRTGYPVLVCVRKQK